MTIQKRLNLVIGILMALAMIVLMFAPVVTAKAKTGDSKPIGMAVCTAKCSLKLRSGPSSKYKVVVKLPARTFVKVYAQSGKWFQVEYKGKLAWGSSSYLSFAAYPADSMTLRSADRTYTIYYQSDSKWKLSGSVKKKACMMTAYAITINNMGIPATPRFIYESNKRRTIMNMAKLKTNFDVVPVSALASDSPYLKSFDGTCTYVSNPGSNGVAAIKAAIDKHPEGVICYFKKGSKAHAIVACKYDGNTIYYSDPGRKRSTLLKFNDTWVYYKHRMTYKNLAYIVALDTVEETLAPPVTPPVTPTEAPAETPAVSPAA